MHCKPTPIDAELGHIKPEVVATGLALTILALAERVCGCWLRWEKTIAACNQLASLQGNSVLGSAV